jgi:hypothetical protein
MPDRRGLAGSVDADTAASGVVLDIKELLKRMRGGERRVGGGQRRQRSLASSLRSTVRRRHRAGVVRVRT